MKKGIILAFVILVFVLGFIFFTKDSTEALIEETITVTTYTSAGVPTGTALVSIAFLADLDTSSISVSLDLNNDGGYSDDERVVDSAPANPQKNWKNSFYFASPEGLDQVSRAQVVVNGKAIDVGVITQSFAVGELLDLETVTNPEESMKGLSIVYAQTDTDLTTDGVPDLNQRKGECAPTSAANSLIGLIKEHGDENQQPESPTALIDDLKKHMKWTPENGVLPDDFVQGKNEWAAANGIPIRTKKVGDTNGVSTVDAIREALESGDAVEIRIKFGNAQGKVVGGHMVTVTGYHEDGDEITLDINDPVTQNSGTEGVEISGNQVLHYGPWQGITVLSWGFVQSWEGNPTGVELDPLTDEEISGIRAFVGDAPTPIKVVKYGNKFLPVSQLIVEDEIGCGADHWHASEGVVTATDGSKVPDPGPQCGYGKVSENPVIDLPTQ